MNLQLAAALLLAVSAAHAQEGGAGIGVGAADKATTENAKGGGASGACADAPESPAPAAGSLLKDVDLGQGTFPDVAFHKGKLWVIYRVGEEIRLLSGKPDLSDLAPVKTFTLLKGAGGFPRLTAACGTLWAAWRDGEPEEAVKLWRMDTGAVEDLGPAWGNHPVTLGQGMVAWQSFPDRILYRRALTGGPKIKVRDTVPTGLSRILPGGAVKWWDEDRLAVPWGIGAWFAGDLISAEDFHDNGTWAKLPGKEPVHLWAGARAFTAKAAADGAGRYAIAVWQPSVRVAVFNAAGIGSVAAAQEPIVWALPANNASGSGTVNLAGMASAAVRKVEILVNLKKVGDAKLIPGAWTYELDTAAYAGGINVSALATLADGKPFRQTIRFNVTR